MSDIGLIFFRLFILGLIVLFWMMRLKTEINETEIRIHFFPFIKRQASWKEIKCVKIVNYGCVGGWGIRLGTTYGTVYNTTGNKGLAIELTNGKKFLIGTQKEIEIVKKINKTYDFN